MNKQQLEEFLLRARAKTYAGATGKAKPLLPGSVQYEYAEGDYTYRDVYFIGNGVFPGLETIYFNDKPVWSMSYYGNFSGLTEEQADKMLRTALQDNWQTTRTYTQVKKDYGNFAYSCDGQGDMDELSGTEEITVGDNTVFYFYYAGGFIG